MRHIIVHLFHRLIVHGKDESYQRVGAPWRTAAAPWRIQEVLLTLLSAGSWP